MWKTFRAHAHEPISGGTLRRITKAALGGLAGCALVLGASQAANGDSANMTYLLQNAPTGDFQENPGPFDRATGTLRVSQAPDEAAAGFKLTVEGIQGATGQEFGAHLHTGPCVNGDYAIAGTPKLAGSQAGPHYNHQAALGDQTPDINPQTEVWFNLIPNDHGEATYDTKVDFVPLDTDLGWLPGEMSIVIHVSPTNPATGGAGARQACFKLLTPDWIG